MPNKLSVYNNNMPELPEVQTVINTLNHSGLLNQTISDIKIYKPKLIKNTTPSKFVKFLTGEKFIIIERIGKFLIFKMSHQKVLVVHLRMEGKMFYEPKNYSLPKSHLRIEFILNNQHTLRYYDSRIFGTFDIYQGSDYLKAQQINKLGLDPLDKDFN
ncbi:hypothetical protein FACS1894166_11600 [Bacilli bacterium]|nr:hypothetical protein FACS1894166_11600 [Bacilli bacterium]